MSNPETKIVIDIDSGFVDPSLRQLILNSLRLDRTPEKSNVTPAVQNSNATESSLQTEPVASEEYPTDPDEVLWD